MDTLKVFKENVHEVRRGQECGIGLLGFEDIAVGDVIKSIKMVEEKRGVVA